MGSFALTRRIDGLQPQILTYRARHKETQSSLGGNENRHSQTNLALRGEVDGWRTARDVHRESAWHSRGSRLGVARRNYGRDHKRQKLASPDAVCSALSSSAKNRFHSAR